MQAKRKLFITSIISFIASAVALTSFTFAWFKFGFSVHNMMELSSGDSEAVIETHIYERRFGALETTPEVAYYVDQTNTLNVTQSSQNNGAVNVDFSNLMAADYDLMTAYLNENALNALALPAYYLELRVIKPESYGYIGIDMDYVSIPTVLVGEMDLSSVYPFNYRYVAIDNVSSTPMVSAIPDHLSTLEAKTLSPFFRTSQQRTDGVAIFDATDLEGAPLTSTLGLAPQCFVAGFDTLVSGNPVFATSILIEISLDPVMLLSYLNQHPNLDNSTLRFGLDFNVNVQYSNAPIWA